MKEDEVGMNADQAFFNAVWTACVETDPARGGTPDDQFADGALFSARFLNGGGDAPTPLSETLDTLHRNYVRRNDHLPMPRLRRLWRSVLFDLARQDERFDLMQKDPAWVDQFHPLYGNPRPDLPRYGADRKRRQDFPPVPPRPYPL